MMSCWMVLLNSSTFAALQKILCRKQNKAQVNFNRLCVEGKSVKPRSQVK
ncbi:hypothetical protein Gotur_025941 [Gossypium turneri]